MPDITIGGRHGRQATFAVFMEPPTVSARERVFTHLWTSVTTGGYNMQTHTNDSAKLVIEDSFYACVGSSCSGAEDGSYVKIDDSRLVETPGASFELSITPDYPFPRLNPSSAESTGPTKDGAFSIITGDNVIHPYTEKTVMIGVGKKNPITGRVVLTGTMLARPNTTYHFQPHMKFSIVVSPGGPGMIVDLRQYGWNASLAEVDFTEGQGLAHKHAVVERGADGTFNVSYRPHQESGSGLGWTAFRA